MARFALLLMQLLALLLRFTYSFHCSSNRAQRRARFNRVPVITTTLRSSVYVSADDVGGVLYEAARAGDAAKVREICSKHAMDDSIIDWHHPEEWSATPIIIATRAGHSNCLKALIEAGGDPNMPDSMAESPSHLACKLGHDACLEVLISAGGADLNARSRIGATPAYWAAFRGHDKCLSLLAAAGADLGIPNSFNVSPLAMAQREGHGKCIDIVQRAGKKG